MNLFCALSQNILCFSLENILIRYFRPILFSTGKKTEVESDHWTWSMAQLIKKF